MQIIEVFVCVPGLTTSHLIGFSKEQNFKETIMNEMYSSNLMVLSWIVADRQLAFSE